MIITIFPAAWNRERDHGPIDQLILEWEAQVLELLIRESYFLEKEG